MTFDKVKGLLAEQLNVDEAKITPSSKIVEDLGADSLDIVTPARQVIDGKLLKDPK